MLLATHISSLPVYLDSKRLKQLNSYVVDLYLDSKNCFQLHRSSHRIILPGLPKNVHSYTRVVYMDSPRMFIASRVVYLNFPRLFICTQEQFTLTPQDCSQLHRSSFQSWQVLSRAGSKYALSCSPTKIATIISLLATLSICLSVRFSFALPIALPISTCMQTF